jgi:hypothetical protein
LGIYKKLPKINKIRLSLCATKPIKLALGLGESWIKILSGAIFKLKWQRKEHALKALFARAVGPP